MTNGTVRAVHRAPDLRTLIADLERMGRLRRIDKVVDPTWEPASLVKWMFQALPDSQRFAMLFENVEGSAIPLLVGALGSSRATVAAALGVDADAINSTLLAALEKKVPPTVVERAVSQQIVKADGQQSLLELPVPTWTPTRDAGPYITTMVVTKHAGSGVQNTGIYRTQVLDGRRVLVNLSPNRQGTRNIQTYRDAGKKAPIAWVIGAAPAVYLAAVANLPYGQDEMDVAGALQGTPVELVRARTQGLLVPAEAEIVIEGEITHEEDATEGPFGEFAGFMSHPGKRPIAHITAITHREDPIYVGIASQMPPSESTILQSITNAAVLLKTLRDLGDPNVVDVYIDPTFGGQLAHGIVSIRTHYPGHGRRVGRLVADLTGLKRITVVDDDVDVRDPDHVDWALNARYNPATDTEIVDNVFYFMDPALPRAESRTRAMGSKLVIDATAKHDPGAFSLPPREMMLRALDVWKSVGLPEFEIPLRAKYRIERS